jgi:hypothetical protein
VTAADAELQQAFDRLRRNVIGFLKARSNFVR